MDFALEMAVSSTDNLFLFIFSSKSANHPKNCQQKKIFLQYWHYAAD